MLQNAGVWLHVHPPCSVTCVLPKVADVDRNSKTDPQPGCPSSAAWLGHFWWQILPTWVSCVPGCHSHFCEICNLSHACSPVLNCRGTMLNLHLLNIIMFQLNYFYFKVWVLNSLHFAVEPSTLKSSIPATSYHYPCPPLFFFRTTSKCRHFI